MKVKAEKGLIVREHERKAVELPSEFTVCEEHSVQVQFTPASDSIGPRCIACTTVDLSTGGAGVETRHFLPRMTEGVLCVYHGAAGGKRTLILEEPVRVRRVEMMGREAIYALGLAFVNRGAELERRITDALTRLHGEDSQEAGHA